MGCVPNASKGTIYSLTLVLNNCLLKGHLVIQLIKTENAKCVIQIFIYKTGNVWDMKALCTKIAMNSAEQMPINHARPVIHSQHLLNLVETLAYAILHIMLLM